MPDPYNPFSMFKTPEYKEQNLWDKWLQFQEIMPYHPKYMDFNPTDRSYLRNKAMGYEDSDELYRDLMAQVKDADSTTRSKVFNQMMSDDDRWQNQWSLEDKLKIREIGGLQIDPEEEYVPPGEGEIIASRQLGAPTLEESREKIISGLQRRQEFQQAEAEKARKEEAEGLFRKTLEIVPGPQGDIFSAATQIPVVRSVVNPVTAFFARKPGEAATMTGTALQFLAGKQPEEGPKTRGYEQMTKLADPLYEFGREYKEAVELVLPGREVGRIEDIDGVGSAMIYGLETISELGAFMGSIAIGGGVAGAAGKMFAIAIPSISEVADEIYEETGEYRPEIALPLGLTVMALEKVGAEQIFSQFTKPFRKKLTNTIVARLLEGLNTAGVEGVTEMAQELITISGGRLSNEEKELLAKLSEEDLSRLVNAAVAGVIGGAGLSSIGQGYKQYMSPEEQSAIEKLRATLGEDQIAMVDSMLQKLMQRPMTQEDIDKRLAETQEEIAAKEATAEEFGEMERVYRERVEGVPSELFEVPETGGARILDAEGNVIQAEGPLEVTEEARPEAAAPIEPGQRQLEVEEEAARIAAAEREPLVRPVEEAEPPTAPPQLVDAQGRPIEAAQEPAPRVPLPQVRTEIDSAIDFMAANGMEEGGVLLGRLRDGEDLNSTERAALDEAVVRATELEPEIGAIMERLSQARIGRVDRIFTDEDLTEAVVRHVEAGITTQAEVVTALGEQNQYKTDAKKVGPVLRRLAEEGRISREKVSGKYVLAPVQEVDEQTQVFNDAISAQRAVWKAAEDAGVAQETAFAITTNIGEEGTPVEELAASDPDIAAALEIPEVATATTNLTAAAAAYDEFHRRPGEEAPAVEQPTLYGAGGEVVVGRDRGDVIYTGAAFVERAIPQLEGRLQQLTRITTDSEAFGQSDIYDRTYPIPREGGILAATQTQQYATDPAYKAKVDEALGEIADTIIKTNAQLLTLRLAGTEPGVTFMAEKVHGGFTADPKRAWKMEAMSKYKEAGSMLGNISVREVVQNSVDAVTQALAAGTIRNGKIAVELHGTPLPWADGFVVEDNGIGMSDVDIRDVFLSLHSTGKDTELTAGGFGTGKAIALVPNEGATWNLQTRDNYYDNDLATAEDQIQAAPMREGSRLEVKAGPNEHGDIPDIIDKKLFQYLETSVLPKNIELTVNGKKLKNPFARRKSVTETHEFELEGKKTKITIHYYPNAPEGAHDSNYDQVEIIRLVNPRTGVTLTQNVSTIYNSAFKGTIIVDVETEATPGEGGYPLDNARMRLQADIKAPVTELIAARGQEGISAQRATVTSRDVSLTSFGRWGEVAKAVDDDPEYQALAEEAKKIFEELDQFGERAVNESLEGTSVSPPLHRTRPFTPLGELLAKVDVGYKGPRGSKFVAMHMLAYETAARMMAPRANAPLDYFYPLFSKVVNGTQVLSEYGGASLGYNPYGVREVVLNEPLVYALYLKDLVDHELTHFFSSGHTEDFTSTLPTVQRNTSTMLPYLLRIAEKVLGKTDTLLTREERVDRYFTPEQQEFIYANFEQEGIGGATDDLYYPVAEGDDWQLGLFEPDLERSTAPVSRDEAPADVGGRAEQPGRQGDVLAGARGVAAGRVPTGTTTAGGRTLAPPGQPGSLTKPQRSPAMREMAEKYQKMLNEAETHEELDRASELWAREKRRPWGINFEEQVKAKRSLIGGERKPTREQAAVMARGRRLTAREARKAPVPAPGGEAAPRLYDAEGRLVRGVEAKEEAEPEAPEAAAPVEEAPKVAKKEKKAPKKAPEKVEQPLSTLQQRVFDAIEGGERTITKIERLTGINKKAINRILRQLEKRGDIEIGIQPKEGGQERFYALKPGEVVEGVTTADMKQRDQEAKERRQREKEKEEAAEAETDYERVKRQFEQATTEREVELEDRERSSQAGNLQLGTTKQEETANEEDAETRNEWRKRWFDRLVTGGQMTVAQQRAFDTLVKQEQEAVIKWAQADRRLIDNHVRRLAPTRKDRNRMGKVMSEFLIGNITKEEMITILDLDPKDKAVTDLEKKRNENSERHQKLLDSGLLPKDVEAALQDNEFYLRMAYARFLTDKRVFGRWRRYQPTEVDKKAATDTIEVAFAKEIKRVAKAVQETALTLPKDFDLVRFMNDTKHEDTEHMLEDMDPKEAEALKILRDKVQEWGKALRFEASFDGFGVTAVRKADEIRQHAVNAVANLLDPRAKLTAGGELKNVRNLERRILSDVFKRLYGEIEDPGVLQALTVEAQGNLLAQATFFREMLHMGEGTVWTREANDRKGLTEKLGSRENPRDVFRYGALAGAYVTPQFKEFLEGTGQIHTSIRDLLSLGNPDGKMAGAFMMAAYGSLQGTTRMMALMTFGAWWRNAISSVVTFALQSGDAFHPTFFRNLHKALLVAMEAWSGNEAGMRKLAEDMRSGAFSYTQASIVTDLKPAVGVTAQRLWEGSEPLASSWRVAKNIPRKLKEFYILIDFAAKKAAWELRHEIAIEKGLSEELATQHAREHVEKHYQNANRVPKIIQQIGVLGMGDFLGFKYDSGRMALNALGTAFVSVAGRQQSPEGSKLAKFKGVANEHPELLDTWQPTIGFLMARLWPVAFGLYGPGQYLLAFGSKVGEMAVKGSNLVQTLMNIFRPDDEEEDKEFEEVSPELEAAVNEITETYNANMPKWVVKYEQDGKKGVLMTPLGSQFGNAMEDWMLGHAQRINRGGETLEEVLESNWRPENIINSLPIGMTYQNIIEMITGFDPQTQFRQDNVIDAIRAFGRGEKEEAIDEVKGAFLNFIADTAGGLGRSYKEAQVRERRAGREPTKGTRLKKLEGETAGDIIWEIAKPMVRLLRMKEYNEAEVLRVLPYKLGSVTGKVQGSRSDARFAFKQEKKLGEYTNEELAKSQRAMQNYTDGLRDAESRMQKMRPLFDYLEITEESMIAVLLDDLPKESGLTRDEAEAVVYGKVDDYLKSDKMFRLDIEGEEVSEEDMRKPIEIRPTRRQSGEDYVRDLLKAEPYTPSDYIIMQLQAEGYDLGDQDAVNKYYEKIRRWRKDVLAKSTRTSLYD